MPRFEKGDRVRVVTFEGFIASINRDAVLIVSEDEKYSAYANPADLKHVELPVKVGDKVTADNLEALPEASVILSSAPQGLAAQKLNRIGQYGWYTGISIDEAVPPASILAHWDATVLHLGRQS